VFKDIFFKLWFAEKDIYQRYYGEGPQERPETIH